MSLPTAWKPLTVAAEAQVTAISGHHVSSWGSPGTDVDEG
jgi:hypothetical protein